MWTCSNCGKSFKNNNQWHSCSITTVDSHLINKPETIVEIFNRVIDICERLGSYELNPVKTAIQFRAKSTFLSMRFTSKYVRLEFQSKKELTDDRIEKQVRISKNRIFYSLKLTDPKHVDKLVKSYLTEAYKLSLM